MKSIKPGRGPSGMSFIGSVVAIIFGVFWTIIAISITSNSPFGMVGIIFPLFGILFIIVGIIQAFYHYKNATGENRFSIFDITDSSEEGDPSDKWIKSEFEAGVRRNNSKETHSKETNFKETHLELNYCPYCGVTLDTDFSFCPKCGKSIRK